MSTPRVPEYRCVEAVTPGQRAEVYHLRALCYTADLGRTIPPLADEFDALDSCKSYLLLASENGRTVGTIRPCVYDPSRPDRPVPVLSGYPGVIQSAFGARTGFVQSTHFGMHPAAGRAELGGMLLLFREVFRTAVEHSMTVIVTVVKNRASYVNFYRRLGFEVIAAGSPYGPFGGETALLATDTSRPDFRRISSAKRFGVVFDGLV